MTQKTLDTANRISVCLRGIANALFWIVISWVWYKGVLFRCLPEHSFIASRGILAALLLVFGAAGSVLTLRKDKDRELCICRGLLCAYGLYTAAAYRPILPRPIQIFLLVVGVLSAAAAGCIILRPIRPGSPLRRRRIFAIRFKKAAAGVLMVVGVSSSALLAVLGAGRLFRNSLFKAKVKPTTSAVEEQTIANNLEMLSLLTGDRWTALSVEQKLDVLQVVANVEQRYLGLPTELTVGAANLTQMELPVVSGYCEETHEILVDLDSLLNDTSWELVNSIAHEARHCYQYRLAEVYQATQTDDQDLLLFREALAPVFADELANYEDAKDNFQAYYDQQLERDARDYADAAEYDYRRQLETHAVTAAGEEAAA